MHEPCCRGRRRVSSAAVIFAFAFVVVSLAALAASIGENIKRADGRFASLSARLKSVESHRGEILRYSDAKRAELADELRKEINAAESRGVDNANQWYAWLMESTHKIVERIDGQVAGLRHDLDAEIVASENDAFTESADFYDAIDLIQRRLANIEARKPEPPKPCPPSPVVYEWRQVGCDRLFGYQDGLVFRYVLRLGR